jgi:hypothetical protein
MYVTCFLFLSISLIFTTANIVMSANVQPVPLASNMPDVGSAVKISGWGANTQTGGRIRNNLARLNTTTITNAECRSRHNETGNESIFVTKLCTFGQANQGTCFGDEGGALVDNFGAIVGVASWQIPCGVGIPDVYERIADKLLWILSIID